MEAVRLVALDYPVDETSTGPPFRYCDYCVKRYFCGSCSEHQCFLWSG